MGSSFKQDRGFTLTEVIITIVVVAVALLGLLGSISFVAGRHLSAEATTTATELAQEKMEEKIAKKRGTGYSASPALDIGTTTENPVSGFSNYKRDVEICNVDANFLNPSCSGADNGSGYKRITVKVNYVGSLLDLPAGDLVSLVTVVANY